MKNKASKVVAAAIPPVSNCVPSQGLKKQGKKHLSKKQHYVEEGSSGGSGLRLESPLASKRVFSPKSEQQHHLLQTVSFVYQVILKNSQARQGTL